MFDEAVDVSVQLSVFWLRCHPQRRPVSSYERDRGG
jgi:hypothetical protein